MKSRSSALAASAALAIAVVFAAPANAGTVTTFVGQDDGAPITGPFPSSAAAQTNFLAAAGAFGTLSINHDFEDQPVGFSNSNTWSNGDGTFTLSASTPNFGNGFSGISNIPGPDGNLDGFNVGSGTKWLGFPLGSATFNNTNPTNSFGAYFTGLQTVFSGTNGLVVTFTDADGTLQTLFVPINVNGGAEYFGFTDTAGFSSVTFTNTTNDAWGMDNVQFNVSSVAPVPLPATLPLFATGVGALGLLGWRRKRKTAVSNT